jgi:pimeloyl-ACP methyl ester carboxylesterase
MLNRSPDPFPLIDQGQGTPTLVFLHYFSGAAASWQWVITDLQADFHCIALDLPGFGQAPPLETPSLKNYSAYIWDVLSGLGVDRCVLIGHSMGGKMALQAAIDSVFAGLEQVILIAPSPATQEPMPTEERDRLLKDDHHHPETAQETVDGATQRPLMAPQRTTAMQTHTTAEDHTWRWWLLDGMNHSIADQLEHIQVPVTVIASPDDPVIPLEAIQRDVVDLLPGSSLIQLPELGHLMPLEAPRAIAQTIRQIITTNA